MNRRAILRLAAAALVVASACTGSSRGRSGHNGATPTETPHAGTLSLRPVADSFVRSDQPGSNFGTLDTLRVRFSKGLEKEAFLEFDVRGLPHGVGVSAAALQLYADGRTGDTCPDAGVGGAVYEVADRSWTETNITWRNKPAPAGPLLDAKDAFPGKAYVSFDVTPAVTGNGIVSFEVVVPSDCGKAVSDTDFEARESTRHPPLLRVTTEPQTGSASASHCLGIGVAAGADLHSYIDGATNETFCLAGSGYDIGPEPLTPGDDVTIIGRPATLGASGVPGMAFGSTTLPEKTFGGRKLGLSTGALPTRIFTTEAPQLLDLAGSRNTTLANLDLHGARAVSENQTTGRVISGGLDVTLTKVRVHGGANQGIGGFEGGRFDHVEIDHNGSAPFAGVTSGGIKTGSAAGYTITNSFVHSNFGPGIWCDHSCDNFRVLDNVVVRNSGSGIRYEHGANVAACSTCDAVIERNLVQDNGLWPTDVDASNAGISISSSENAIVAFNVLGGNYQSPRSATAPNGVYLQSGRHPLVNVLIHDNVLNGDGVKSCDTSGVTCRANS